MLVFALFVLTTLGLLTTALLFVSTQQRRIADARTAALRARVGAEYAARGTLAAWSTAAYRDLEVGGVRAAVGGAGTLPDGTRYDAGVERLAGRIYLVRAWAETGPVGPAGGSVDAATAHASVRVGMLVRGIDPVEPWAGFGAALTVGGGIVVGADAVVDGIAVDAVPPGWTTADCGPDAADAHTAVFGPGPLPGIVAGDPARVQRDAAASVTGDPPIAEDAAARRSGEYERLGPLGAEDIAALADRVAVGSVELGPRYRDGRCDPVPLGNWGSPLDPYGPCGGYAPLVYSPGDLTVTGGAGQGVLVVDGDLALAGDARVYGAILVRGQLRVGRDAAVHGAASVAAMDGAGLVDGEIRYNACALSRAFGRAPALDRPFRPGRRWWVPLF